MKQNMLFVNRLNGGIIVKNQNNLQTEVIFFGFSCEVLVV